MGTPRLARGLVVALLSLTASTPSITTGPDWVESAFVEAFDIPTETIGYRDVIELAEAALEDYPHPVTIRFKKVLFEDQPYTSGVWRRATKTIELRSTMTYKGIRYTLVHEVAHARTEGHDADSHGPSWCAEYARLLQELLPEYAEQQIRFVKKRYDC